MNHPLDIWRTQFLPSVVWIELTSRCPFDCVFCTRKSMRGTGEHMDFQLYSRLIGELGRPQVIRLNYAGESGHYPKLVEAVALAVSTGAEVEMVTALASLNPERLRSALQAGLRHLTVSLHSLDPARFQEIYRFSSLDALRERLQEVLSWRNVAPWPFTLDLAFVAMERNLEELPTVAAFARAHGIPVLAVHPLIGRDPLPLGQAVEHDAAGQLAEGFRTRLLETLAHSRAAAPEVDIQLSSHELAASAALGTCAQAWPWPLPVGAHIACCDQSPFETAHILSDGRVVACEVTEKASLGELSTQSFHEIWHGNAYRRFRNLHTSGEHPSCAGCTYKQAYTPTPAVPRLAGASATPLQLLRGWHADDGSGLRWSQAEAALWLPYTGQKHLFLRGILAVQQPQLEAAFSVRINGQPVHHDSRPSPGHRELVMTLPPDGNEAVLVELNCNGAASPFQLRQSGDLRVLGFGLIEACLL